MLFHSPAFLFYFLPLALLLHRLSLVGSAKQHYGSLPRLCLLLLTLTFYGWNHPWWLIPFAVSVVFDFVWANSLRRVTNDSGRRLICFLSIAQNLCLLGFFKYWNAVVWRLAHWYPTTSRWLAPHGFEMPAGISFYTFESLSFVIDVYRREISPPSNPLDFFGFMAMFPRFIAGPIARYRDIVPQFRNFSGMHWQAGLFLFVQGLFLKLCLADSFAVFSSYATLAPSRIDLVSAWLGTLAYALQLYFDFAGYSLMAIGLGKCLGFEFPENFRQPYLAGSLQDFWRRWHTSLSSWLRDYVYQPLGGNRGGVLAMYRNILITMLLGGIWHGAGLCFLLWGLWHGLGLCLERAAGWHRRDFSVVGQARTFLLVLLGWVFFQASSPTQAAAVFKAMLGFGKSFSFFDREILIANPVALFFCLAGILYCFYLEPRLAKATQPLEWEWTLSRQVSGSAMLASSLVFGFSQFTIPFLYFQF